VVGRKLGNKLKMRRIRQLVAGPFGLIRHYLMNHRVCLSSEELGDDGWMVELLLLRLF